MIDDPLIGQQLGNYLIKHTLGRGGMAQVYYGWDVNLDRPAALKVIDMRFRDSPAYEARFVREARAVAAWRHENIVQVYHADKQEEVYYFAMEYVEGIDLRKLIDQYAAEGELMPHEDVLRVGTAIAEALDYAHEKGVIHRDIKPSNVMITEQGRVVLMDFGLAMDVEQGSIGEAFGSPHYISPEQARSSSEAVPQSDLYSLGVILYEVLTGALPFDDPSSTTVALQHLNQPPPPPREVNSRLNVETEAVLLKALSKSPEERYPSGAALLQALDEALSAPAVETTPLELPPPPPEEETPRPFSRMSIQDKVALYIQASPHPEVSDAQSANLGDDLIGQQLDDFRLEEMLGHGGMARIYRGLEIPLDRHVAIKVIDLPFRADPDYLIRFEREARTIAKLEHPGIVSLYHYGKDKGLLYMAMQYIDGADLATVMDSYCKVGEYIEPQHVLRIVREVCEALDYAHGQGVIHRDIKPANIMINRQDHAILTDFGLALLTEAGSRGAIFGSPHYIAPEQAISSASAIPQSDLYSVGVILYEIFTGQVPFNAKSPLDIAMQHMSEIPRPPRELRPGLDAQIEAVILKAIAKEAQDRYTTGKELADALEQALGATPLQPVEANTFPSLHERVSQLHSQPTPETSTEHSAPVEPSSADATEEQAVSPASAPPENLPEAITEQPAPPAPDIPLEEIIEPVVERPAIPAESTSPDVVTLPTEPTSPDMATHPTAAASPDVAASAAEKPSQSRLQALEARLARVHLALYIVIGILVCLVLAAIAAGVFYLINSFR